MNLLDKIKNWSVTDRVAYICDQSQLTYSDLEEKSNRLAAWIHVNLNDDTSPIIVYGHMEPEMIIAFLACVKSGHPYIPIDVSVPQTRVIKIINDSKSQLIISPQALPLEMMKETELTLDDDHLSDVLESEIYGDKPLNGVSGEDIFYIIYTSGSTGHPKGVQVTSNCLESFVTWAVDSFHLDEKGEVYLNQAPYSFDLSVMDLYPGLVTGGTIWAVQHDLIASPKRLFESFSVSNIAIWTSTPSFIEMCLSDPHFNERLMPKLNTFIFCGEVLAPETVRLIHHRFPAAKVFNTYGPTEATVAVTSIEITKQLLDEYTVLPVGYVKPDCAIEIVEPNGQVVSDGTKGEITIIGSSVSRGYLGNQTLTEKSFFNKANARGYKTGDAGYIVNGLLFYNGRLDYQIKLNGYRIEIEEIEYHLRSTTYVQQAVVIPTIKDGKCQYLTAYVVPTEHTFEKEYQLTSAIKKHLAGIIPSYMIPRKFQFVNALPMTANGKVNRKGLLEEINT